MKRILLISEFYPPKVHGGGEITAKTLAESLSKKDHLVSVLTSEPKERKDEENRVNVIYSLKSGDPKSLWGTVKRNVNFQKSLRNSLNKKNINEKNEILHFLNTTSIPSFPIKNKKTVATINGYTQFCPKGNLFYKDKKVCNGCSPSKFINCITKSEMIGKVKIPFYLKYNPIFWLGLYNNYLKRKKNLKNVNQYISISDFITKQLVKAGIRKENITKVYNIHNVKENNKHLNLQTKGIVVTFIGSLEKFKGIELLIKSFRNIKEEATLVIAGEGSLKKKIEDNIKKNENIKILGKISYDYIPSLYQKSDIIIQPALWPEPFSRIMLEATFFGKPIIATDVGGNKEGVINGKNGFLVKPRIEELRKAMVKIIEDKNLRDKMGKESKKLYEEKFQHKKILSKILEVYSK